jgi:hypothetical protein
VIRIYFILHFCLLLTSHALAKSYNPEDLTGAEGREILCSALTKIQENNGKNVWPGFNPVATPLIVKFKDGIYGYGNLAPFSGWTKEVINNCVSYFAPKDFKAPESPIVLYLNLGGVNAFFFNTTVKPKLSSWLLSSIIHERFHRFQFENFSNVPLLAAPYTAHSSSDIVAAALLENHRLSTYLKSESEEDWIDFLSITTYREPLLSLESQKRELGEQIFEGIASYVQLKSFEAIENEFGLNFRETWKQRMSGNMDDAKGVDGIIKWRHYTIGGIISSFLDHHFSNESWKLKLQNEKEVSLFRQVLPFLNLNESQLKSRAQAIITSSEGDQARTKASSMISQYLSDIKTVKDQILSHTFQIKVSSPSSQDCRGGGFSERTYYLPEGGSLNINYTGTLECQSGYQVAFNDISVLEQTKESSFFGTDKVKIWINSLEIAELHDGTYSFNALRMEGDFFSLQSPRSGELSISGHSVLVKFFDLSLL